MSSLDILDVRSYSTLEDNVGVESEIFFNLLVYDFHDYSQHITFSMLQLQS